jgi:chemotaxis protein MotB
VARRRRQQDEHENLERWLVSYADFVTLLFAFFVVMYAISSVNEGKYRVLSDTLTEAFRDPVKSTAPARGAESQPLAAVIEPIRPIPSAASGSALEAGDSGSAGVLPAGSTSVGERQQGRTEDLDRLAEQITDELQPFLGQRLIEISRIGDTLEVAMKSQMLFESGSARLAPQAMPALEGVGRVLAEAGNAVRVEGHTDNRPINTLQFPSNWELSAARAASVVHFLVRVGVEPGRMAAIGYGEHRPVGDNTLDDGRQRNRRVTLAILGTKAQPVVLPAGQVAAAADVRSATDPAMAGSPDAAAAQAH